MESSADVYASGVSGAVEFFQAFAPLVGLAIGLSLAMKLVPLGFRMVARFALPQVQLLGGAIAAAGIKMGRTTSKAKQPDKSGSSGSSASESEEVK